MIQNLKLLQCRIDFDKILSNSGIASSGEADGRGEDGLGHRKTLTSLKFELGL